MPDLSKAELTPKPELTKVALFTKEFPPYVYGGAGVHVEYLSQALAKIIEIDDLAKRIAALEEKHAKS